MYCAQGHSSLTNIIGKFMDGSVCLLDIKKISEQKTQFQKLCNATGMLNDDDTASSIEKRLMQFKAFDRQKNSLSLLCSQMENAKIIIKG